MNRPQNHEFAEGERPWIELACRRFESAWRRGDSPRLEDYVRECAPPDRPLLLRSLQERQQLLILEQFEANTTSSPDEEFATTTDLPIQLASPVHPVQSSEVIAENSSAVNSHISLRVISGPHAGEEFHYDEHNTLLVGRAPQAQLKLKDDQHFSRYHFRLELNPPTCFLMDLNSRNGTFVNGERVAEIFLKDGDTISGGKTRMVVSISDTANNQLPSVHERPAPQSAPQPPMDITRARDLGAQTTVLPAIDSFEEPDPPVALIRGYEIHDQLGTGEHGTVYRATRTSSGEKCALKVMTSTSAANEKAVQIFLREASVLSQLQHPHIVRMFEMGRTGTDLYLSTEYVDAIPWETLVARSSAAQRIRTASGLMSQILGALEYAHGRAMVHRDVKPANILISRQDGKLVAKLADFGLAKQYSNAGMSKVTRVGDVIGSLPFMPPEQFINSRDAKPACDIYSAGATLYWFITGHEPILLDNHPCKFLAIVEDAPVPIQNYCKEIPPQLAQLVHRALEKAPEKRFRSAAEMRQQLRPFMKWQLDE